MVKRVSLLGLSALLLAMVFAPISSAATRQSRAQENLTVLIGYDGAGPQYVVEEFFTPNLRIEAGTNVTWLMNTPREHTVTFLAGQSVPLESIPQPEDPTPDSPSLPLMRNPIAEFPTFPDGPYDGSSFINSGRLQGGESFSVTFGVPGNFQYICIPHLRDNMRGTVDVVAPGAAGITAQEDIERDTAKDFATFAAQARQMAGRSFAAADDRGDGSQIWYVKAGTDVRSEADGRVGRMTVRQFLPDSLTIKRGDSVVWYTDTRVPVHTVSFPVQAGGPIGRWVPHLADGGFLPLELLAPSGVYRGAPDSLDWPRVVQDVDELRPARPSAVYDPTKYYNSSRLGDPTETQSRAWSLSFNAAGSYQYFCWPHVNVGMIGTITVTS